MKMPKWTSKPPTEPCAARIRAPLFPPRKVYIYADMHQRLHVCPWDEAQDMSVPLNEVAHYTEWQYPPPDADSGEGGE